MVPPSQNDNLLDEAPSPTTAVEEGNFTFGNDRNLPSVSALNTELQPIQTALLEVT